MSSDRPASRTRVCAVAIGVTVMLAGLVACGDDDKSAGSPPTPPKFPTAMPSLPTRLPTHLPTSPGTEDTTDAPTTAQTPSATKPTTPRPKTSNFSSGECLAGEIAGTETQQDELTEVPCSDPAAAFKVLARYPYLLGSHQCAYVSGVDYEYQEYVTINGVPTGTGTMYCLQAL